MSYIYSNAWQATKFNDSFYVKQLIWRIEVSGCPCLVLSILSNWDCCLNRLSLVWKEVGMA